MDIILKPDDIINEIVKFGIKTKYIGVFNRYPINTKDKILYALFIRYKDDIEDKNFCFDVLDLIYIERKFGIILDFIDNNVIVRVFNTEEEGKEFRRAGNPRSL